MAFFLIFGSILGAISVVFVLQNITPITVSFFAWQFDGSLALILFLALLAGILLTVLMLFPGFVRDEVRAVTLRKRIRALERELEDARHDTAEVAMRAVQSPSENTTEPVEVVQEQEVAEEERNR